MGSECTRGLTSFPYGHLGPIKEPNWSRGRLRCLKGFRNKEKILAQIHKWSKHTCKWLAELEPDLSPYVMPLSLSLSPSLPHTDTYKSTVNCSLTQKCQAMTLHLAALVYNALWSRLIRTCDTRFLMSLLKIWILKEQSRKGAFRFSISSILCFNETHVSVFLLRKFIWSRRSLRGFQSGFQGGVMSEDEA